MKHPAEYLQLAKPVVLDKVRYPCRAEVKMDGVRLPRIANVFHTRTGKPVPLNTIKINTSEFFLDIEVTTGNGGLSTRSTTSGMINSAMKNGSIDESMLKFCVLDIMSIEGYKNRFSISYEERLSYLDLFMRELGHPQFYRPEARDIHSHKELMLFYAEVVSKGMEGLVIKYYEDKYHFKRSPAWGKLKLSKTADLECSRVEYGQGKYTDMIGALVLSGIVEDNPVVVNVGSGMTDADRAKNASEYFGKIIEVKYSHVTKSKDKATCSLNQPVFMGIREDLC